MPWGVGLGPEPFGGQGHGQGQLWAQGSEGSLSAGVWGCVPAWLVAWPEASPYWC